MGTEATKGILQTSRCRINIHAIITRPRKPKHAGLRSSVRICFYSDIFLRNLTGSKQALSLSHSYMFPHSHLKALHLLQMCVCLCCGSIQVERQTGSYLSEFVCVCVCLLIILGWRESRERASSSGKWKLHFPTTTKARLRVCEDTFQGFNLKPLQQE